MVDTPRPPSRFDESLKIWMNGKLVDWHDATVHICIHALHYGSALFEGIRCYNTDKGPAILGLQQHIRRLTDGAKIYRMPLTYTNAQLEQACVDVCKVNNMTEAYLRPLVYRGYYALGVHPTNCPIDVSVIPMRWGKYLGAEALEQGVDVCVSSWTRIAPNTLPALAKSVANYANSQLITIDAKNMGFVEGIALDTNGYVSEGSGENIFCVRDGKLVTPPLGNSVLPGITRSIVLTLCKDLGIPVVEGMLPREMLYIADEVFFTGTAAEITPIRSVDHVQVGAGKAGPVTRQLQAAFFDIINGKRADQLGVLTYL